MGFQGGAGQSGMLPGSAAGNSTPWAMAHGLAQEAATWTTCPCDAQRDRRFLATFAFDLVQLFRAEEARLSLVRSPLLGERRRENRRLAQALRELMRQADQGLDVSGGIQAFLRAWHCHQELSPLRGVAAGMMGH